MTKGIVLLICIAFSIGFIQTNDDWTNILKAAFDKAKEKEGVRNEMHTMARQLMLQQFFTEESLRSEGHSGIKQIRIHRTGRRNYYSESHTGGSVCAIHDHSNNIRTVGMGEVVAVLNGVEFRTRHNDYRLYKPHKTSAEYHKTEDIPFPDVPPEVKNKQNINEQIVEMREWFKAWRDQNYKVRDYRKYFKPVLCFMEGAWTTSGKHIDEPFFSDRHFVDAKSWFELQEKFRFTSYTGTKNRLENLPFLPTTVVDVVNGTQPLFAQWNYRILCHPLSVDVPTKQFSLVDDAGARLRLKMPIEKYLHSRAARFTMNTNGEDRATTHTYLDKLMEEIPGKDNYQGSLEDHGIEGKDTVMNLDGKTVKNVAKYHRFYRLKQRDAMGLQLVMRGFSDDFMFAARTTQQKVAGLKVKNPHKCTGWGSTRKCETISQKWSYAIPLEIIYLTPLAKWNPYDLEYKGDSRSNSGKTVYKGPLGPTSRNGGCDPDKSKAYNGTNSRVYYRTPVEFYTGQEVDTDAADTSRRGGACVLDQAGKLRNVMSSGTRIFLPNIPTVGVLRTRYPIMPVHGEGSAIWKEMNAVREILMDQKLHHRLLWDGLINSAAESRWIMSPSQNNKFGSEHVHTLTITRHELSMLKGGREIQKATSMDNNHQHVLKLRWNEYGRYIYYSKCDNQDYWKYCVDEHRRELGPYGNDIGCNKNAI